MLPDPEVEAIPTEPPGPPGPPGPPIQANLPHEQERATADRRATDRRSKPRRDGEIRQRRQDRDFGRIGTASASLGAAIGIWALINAPVTKSATVCTDTFGGELLHHREIHPLWVASMMLCALALALPSRPRRSYVSVGLVGLTFGLAVAAYIRVATWKTGICFV
jgi:hypothetical protein